MSRALGRVNTPLHYRRARSVTQSVQKEDAPLASNGALPSTASTKFSIIG